MGHEARGLSLRLCFSEGAQTAGTVEVSGSELLGPIPGGGFCHIFVKFILQKILWGLCGGMTLRGMRLEAGGWPSSDGGRENQGGLGQAPTSPLRVV